MKRHHGRRVFAEALESRWLLAAADLSGWTGTNNTAAPNNYVVTSQTSAGGTFQSAREYRGVITRRHAIRRSTGIHQRQCLDDRHGDVQFPDDHRRPRVVPRIL